MAQFLYFHRNLVYLHYENLAPVFELICSDEFRTLQNQTKFIPSFNLRKLTFSEGVVSEKGIIKVLFELSDLHYANS